MIHFNREKGGNKRKRVVTEMTTVADVNESLLALEVQRLHDVQADETVDESQRFMAVDQFAEWLVAKWRNDRLFLQQTALPYTTFLLFERELHAVSDAFESESEHAFGLLVFVFRRVAEVADHDGCRAFFSHHVAVEYRAFVSSVDADDANAAACIARLTGCFLATRVIDSVLETTLVATVTQCLGWKEGKHAVLRAVKVSTEVDPKLKTNVFLAVCKSDAASCTRELAAQSMLGLVDYNSSPRAIVSLLSDRSQKVRKVATSAIIDIGLERLEEDLGREEIATMIVTMVSNVHTTAQEKRLISFIADWFADASTLDRVCELSILLDNAGAASQSKLSEVLKRVIGQVLKPSFFARPTASAPMEVS